MDAAAVIDPRVIIRHDHQNNQDPLTVCCPECGGTYSHIQSAYTRQGCDEFEGRDAYPGTVAIGVNAEERRAGIVVEFEGECGHLFEITIQQHKGVNFFTAAKRTTITAVN